MWTECAVRLYALSRMVEVLLYNLHRLHDLWPIFLEHVVEVLGDPKASIRSSALEALGKAIGGALADVTVGKSHRSGSLRTTGMRKLAQCIGSSKGGSLVSQNCHDLRMLPAEWHISFVAMQCTCCTYADCKPAISWVRMIHGCVTSSLLQRPTHPRWIRRANSRLQETLHCHYRRGKG